MNMLKSYSQAMVWFIMTILLSSCLPVLPKITVTQTTLPSNTPSPFYTLTPSSELTITSTATNTPGLSPPPAMRDDEKNYLDPEGWFSIYVPADWEEGESPGSFSGEDGFVEIGYMPDLMFMNRAFDVCTWLANIDTKDNYSVYFASTHYRKYAHTKSCQLTSLPGVHPAAILEVIENPSADLPQRFLYIKADAAQFDRISSTLVWLRPVDYDAQPVFHTAAMRPEDISFWENTAPLPPGISVTEFELPAEVQNEEPDASFRESIPPDVRLEPYRPDTTNPPYAPNSLTYVNDLLRHFGYLLLPGSESHLYDLYKDNALVLNNIWKLPDVQLFSTTEGEVLAFLAHAVKDPGKHFYDQDNAVSYLIQNEAISIWQEGPLKGTDPGRPPIWVTRDLLVVGVGEQTVLEVRNSHRDLLFSFATAFGSRLPLIRFQSWEDHWIMDMTHFIIQDGEILNEKFGFEDAFYWRLINDKPFYFFRKGPRLGISYDGQFLPYYYDSIPFDYG
jgi:hypothetical protein